MDYEVIELYYNHQTNLTIGQNQIKSKAHKTVKRDKTNTSTL